MGSEEIVAGGLVLIYASVYVYSLHSHTNMTHPTRHVLMVIGGSVVTIPYLFQTSSVWYSFPMQLMLNTLVLLLDWFSFHEDKRRFSERNLCWTGPCRRNAMITGHMAHWGNVVGVTTLLLSNTQLRRWPLIVPWFLAYGIVGSQFITHMTRDGSVSDLRGMSDDEKCAQARIMRDGWRGCMNDLISVLGVMVAWQALFTCGDGRCEGPFVHLSILRSMVTDAFDGVDTKGEKMLSSMRVASTIFSSVAPTYSNYVNTSAQHGHLSAQMYGLPKCFD